MPAGCCSECRTIELVEFIEAAAIVIVRQPQRTDLGAAFRPLACGLGGVSELSPDFGFCQIKIPLLNHEGQQLFPARHQQFKAQTCPFHSC